MNTKRFYQLMSFITILSMLITMPQPVLADAVTIYVPDNYATIQGALDAASPGDTVYVRAGTYYEHLIVSKSLTLQGEDKTTTIIDGGGGGYGIHMPSTDNVVISSFTVKNTYYGIFFTSGATYNTVSNIIATGSFHGINNHDQSNHHNTFQNVEVFGNTNSGFSAYAGSDYVKVIDSNIHDNGGSGIQIGWSSNWLVSGTAMTGNSGNGLAIDTATYGTAANNTISNNNEGVHLAGWGSQYNTITSNQITGNTTAGLEFQCTARFNTIVENEISGSGKGVWITRNPTCPNYGNTFHHNTFKNNTVNALDEEDPIHGGNTWDNGYPSGGNTWDNYAGLDQFSGSSQDVPGADGIGDTPYVIPAGVNVDRYPLMPAHQHDPTIQVWFTENSHSVNGRNWPENSLISLTIEDPATPASPDLSGVQQATPCWWGSDQGCVYFEMGDFQFAVGQVITMSDETYTKVFTITSLDLKITNVDPSTDIVSGTAAPNSFLSVEMGGVLNGPMRFVTADSSGNWSANFAVAGPAPREGTFDIVPGTSIWNAQSDDDGDCISDYVTVSAPLNPMVFVSPDLNNVYAWGWTLGTLLTLEVDDPATPQSPDYTATRVQDSFQDDWDHGFFLDGIFDIQPDHQVTVSGAGITKQHNVTHLTVTNVDVAADIVIGSAYPGSIIHVGTICDESGCANRNVLTGPDGNWLADFSTPVGDPSEGMGVFDLRPGDGSCAYEHDEDGDSTRINWYAPNYSFTFFTAWNGLVTENWPRNVPVQITADDPNTPESPDFTDTDYAYEIPEDPGRTRLIYDFPADYIIQPGYTVAISNGQITRTLVISLIQITNVDVATDIVSGIADPFANVVVDSWRGAVRYVIADEYGDWSVDFSELGEFGGDGKDILYDIEPNADLNAHVPDEDGDITLAEWHVPNPNLHVFVTQDRIEARDWPIGNVITLTIENPVTPQSPDYTTTRTMGPAPWNPNENAAEFDLNGIYHYQVGDLITVSDGTLTKIHTVANVAVTSIDPVAETISGTTDPNVEIQVEIHRGDAPYRRVTANDSGQWTVDFSEPWNDQGTYDLTTGLNGAAMRYDDDGDASRADWRVLDPNISVHPDEDWLEGYDWPSGVTVNISIDDPVTPDNPDKTGSAVVGTSDWNSSENYFSFDLRNIYDIKAGFQVVVSGGGVTKEHEVTNLVVTNVNAADDTVSGTSDPNAHLRIDVHNTNGVQMEIDSDANGNWLADFTSQYDLKPGDQGRAHEYDEDWDNTGDDWRIPNPSIGVRANNDQVEGWEWPLDATVIVTVDDPATPALPDITRTAVVYEAPWNPGEYRFDLNLYGEMDIQPGFVVTATLDDVTKTLIVTSLAFTDVDVDLDLVTGIAEPGSRVDVWTCGNNYCVNRHVTADGSGVWSADFAHPGLENDEQDTIDIILGTWIDSSQREDDGDQTMFGQNVPNPVISARPFERQISGYDWPDGALITMTIDDPLTTASPDYTATSTAQMQYFGQTEAMFNLIDLFILKAGHIITMTDSTTTKTHMVTNLAIQSVDVDTDQVSGVADPGHTIQIFVWDSQDNGTASRDVIADSNGNWVADFSIPVNGMTYDIVNGTWGETQEFDNDNDNTNVYWRALNPTITVHPDEDIIEGNDWPLDSTLTVQIGPDYTTTTTVNPVDQDHNVPWFKLDLTGVYDLQSGELVTASDAETTKQVIAASRSITLIDPLTDIITGVSDSSVVYVVLWACDENGCAARRKDVNPDGSWSVNFAVHGELNWESILLDIQPGTNGGVYQSDVDGDGTVYQWILNQPPHADLGPDLVTDEGSTLMLDASASSDPDGDILTYEWDLNNDGTYDDATGVTVNRTFVDDGTYFIGVRVTDSFGASDTDTLQVTVNNIAPLVDIQQVTVSGAVVSGSGFFTDPGADVWAAAVSYGDGSGVQPLALNPDKTFAFSHAYAIGGTYAIQVCVSDDESASGCDQAQVTVTLNRPPVAEAGGPYYGNEGTNITLNASRSTDPDNNIVLYEWDLDNDGQFDDATGVRPKFAAIDNGVFTIRVRVTDAGGLSSVDGSKVTVKNVPPVITSLIFNNSVRAGVRLNTFATFADPGLNDTFTATWKWGDGTTSTGTVSGKTVSGSHIYTKPGIYLITIIVKDKDGGIGQAYKLIIVLPKK